MEFTKEYFEVYALLVLTTLYDKKLEDLFEGKAESPDWQSEKLGIGLEITRALTPERGRKDNAIRQYIGTGMDGKTAVKKQQEKYPEYPNLIKECAGMPYVLEFGKPADNLKKICDMLIEKTRKLNDHYKVFQNNWLYMFGECTFITEDMLKYVEKVRQQLKKEYSLFFDKLFISATTEIYVIDDSGKFEKIEAHGNITWELQEEAGKRTS